MSLPGESGRCELPGRALFAEIDRKADGYPAADASAQQQRFEGGR